MSLRASFSVAVVAALLGSAGAAEQPLTVGLVNQVPAGKKPELKLTARQPLTEVSVALTRTDDNAAFVVRKSGLGRGQTVSLPFGDGKAGHFAWKGHLEATLAAGGTWTFDLTFETATTGALNVTYRRDKLDLDAHTLEFQLSRPAGKADLTVVADDGQTIAEAHARYAGEAPGTWLKIAWTPARAANVLKLELRAESSDGLASVVKLLPWSIAVPHEEVVFETGKWEIRKSEEPKLDQSYQKLIEAVERARKADPKLPVRVFIAGHTDTVGKSDDNRRLSLERAKAIAGWFRDRGLPLPVSYAGFGEEAPKVKTPDNTDEARNRRADYFLAVEEPVVARGVRAEWHSL